MLAWLDRSSDTREETKKSVKEWLDACSSELANFRHLIDEQCRRMNNLFSVGIWSLFFPLLKGRTSPWRRHLAKYGFNICDALFVDNNPCPQICMVGSGRRCGNFVGSRPPRVIRFMPVRRILGIDFARLWSVVLNGYSQMYEKITLLTAMLLRPDYPELNDKFDALSKKVDALEEAIKPVQPEKAFHDINQEKRSRNSTRLWKCRPLNLAT